ncbi:hypothetical protein BESB_071820 [Besnoitia besnoiti]|uniref:Uncharacterized protein n=1 Tax=Besnoitia besnoiti TaxID=94643 RepID=A0A2A9MF84_BESBE|nr:uncharacterized protein BESB_071820 [Besnoitia besnoiti]PFH34030.1 hypothetical protein BESB_071820 [Besnoitia besnoiti]
MGASIRELMKKERERREKERVQKSLEAARNSQPAPLSSPSSATCPVKCEKATTEVEEEAASVLAASPARPSARKEETAETGVSAPEASAEGGFSLLGDAYDEDSAEAGQVTGEQQHGVAESRSASPPSDEPRDRAGDATGADLPADFFDTEVPQGEGEGAGAEIEETQREEPPSDGDAPAEPEETLARRGLRGRGGPRAAPRLEDFLKEADEGGEEGAVEVAFEIEEPSADLLLPLKKALSKLASQGGGSDDATSLEATDAPPPGGLRERSEDATDAVEGERDERGAAGAAAQRKRNLTQASAGEPDAKRERRADRDVAAEPEEPGAGREGDKAGDKAGDTAGDEDGSLPFSISAALLASTAVDEMKWYHPYATVLHSEILHEEAELEDLRHRVEAATRRREAARQAASSALPAGPKASKATKEAKGSRNGADDELERTAEFLRALETQVAAERGRGDGAADTQRGADPSGGVEGGAEPDEPAGEDQLPYGFFDDEERDAEVRGLVGFKKLKELLARVAEKRREVADDLRQKKETTLQQRQDIQRFLAELEEEEQKAAAYRERVLKLKARRPAGSAAETARDERVAKLKSEPAGTKLDENRGESDAADRVKTSNLKEERSVKPELAEEEKDEAEDEEEEDEEDDFAWRAKSLMMT